MALVGVCFVRKGLVNSRMVRVKNKTLITPHFKLSGVEERASIKAIIAFMQFNTDDNIANIHPIFLF